MQSMLIEHNQILPRILDSIVFNNRIAIIQLRLIDSIANFVQFRLIDIVWAIEQVRIL